MDKGHDSLDRMIGNERCAPDYFHSLRPLSPALFAGGEPAAAHGGIVAKSSRSRGKSASGIPLANLRFLFVCSFENAGGKKREVEEAEEEEKAEDVREPVANSESFQSSQIVTSALAFYGAN